MEDSADDSGISDDDADAPSTDKPKRTEIVPEWDLLNGQKAIWLRSPKDVELEEYKSFYAALSQVQPPPRRPLAAVPCLKCRHELCMFNSPPPGHTQQA